jgi:hypothetical protein
MILHWPQITYLVLAVLGIGISLAKHGEPKTGEHNFLTTVLAFALICWILYEGGFFNQP